MSDTCNLVKPKSMLVRNKKKMNFDQDLERLKNLWRTFQDHWTTNYFDVEHFECDCANVFWIHQAVMIDNYPEHRETIESFDC